MPPGGFETAMYLLGAYMALFLLAVVVFAIGLGILTLPAFYLILFGAQLSLKLAQRTGVRAVNYVGMMFRSITRNLLRASLTYFAIFVLVFVISGIWTMLTFIDSITEEKENNLKAIITEKHQIPSMMPRKYENQIFEIAMNLPPEMRPKNGADDFMTWSFIGGSLDPNNQTKENMIFFFAMEPRKLKTMMDGLDELSASELNQLDRAIQEMERNPKAVVIGPERLAMIKKRVGDRFKIQAMNYKGLEFEYEIIGTLPAGTRYDQSAVMTREYFYRAVDEYERRTGKTEMSDKCMNLLWVRLPSKEAFERMAAEVNKPGKFTPAVKMETASTAFGAFLDPYRDLFWGMRYVLSPMIIIIITLVIAIAVSIGVRERRTEMAVLKVLGFKPWQVLLLVLGESLLIGVISGGISTSLIFVFVKLFNGLPFKIAFFPKFMLPTQVLAWGPLIGVFAAFVGSIVPAWTTHRIKAAEVFAKVT
jgi:putative ABC transport system permease protein